MAPGAPKKVLTAPVLRALQDPGKGPPHLHHWHHEDSGLGAGGTIGIQIIPSCVRPAVTSAVAWTRGCYPSRTGLAQTAAAPDSRTACTA